SNASWILSGDVRHLLEMKIMRWWGRGSLGPTEMMTLPRASNASWTLSGDARHLLEMKNMRWCGRGSLGPTEMMTLPRA
ncbi:hypothetical protein H5410_057528, partial [Solanum commersonii]